MSSLPEILSSMLVNFALWYQSNITMKRGRFGSQSKVSVHGYPTCLKNYGKAEHCGGKNMWPWTPLV